MKVERVSYPVMTPSAARGVLEAIFWKPEFSWQVREIAILKPLRRFSILRNEVNKVMSRGTGQAYCADEDRAQRHTLGLRDVAYLIRADLLLKPHATTDEAGYRDQFRRRIERGQCFHRPYLGCREFVAFFGPPDPSETPIELSDDLGRMLFDQVFELVPEGKASWLAHSQEGPRDRRGVIRPRFFPARIERGVLRIPPELYLRDA
jgi:CRISPR-associated protein Cas5d